MITLNVDTNNGSYPIHIGEKILQNHACLRQHVTSQQVLIVSNEQVAPLYMDSVTAAFSHYQCDTLILPDGEQYKTLDTVSQIIDALAKQQHHRDTTLIALGGGVVGDMTGFAAACYHRGVAFIQIPTTLLAQVDSSIGGKTGVDHPQGKNLIGAFHQPKAVITDISTLNTLSDRQFKSGIAEVIKAAIIQDSDFFGWLEQHLDLLLQRDPNTIIETLQQACTIKRDIVAADEKEQGIRALLNLGHTFGHAIEQNLAYQDWLHGEAVGIGILMAADLSLKLNWLPKTDHERIQNLLAKLNLPKHLPAQIKCDTLLAAMDSDKKIVAQQLRFILIKAIGQAVITSDITKEQLSEIINAYLID